MPPPMKFWEALSAFRSDEITLREIFGSDKWRATYYDLFLNFDELVRKQDRQVLDTPLPIELTREIATQSLLRFYFYPEQQILRKAQQDSFSNQQYIELTALEVHDRFGGTIIEEVLEHSSARVSDET